MALREMSFQKCEMYWPG